MPLAHNASLLALALVYLTEFRTIKEINPAALGRDRADYVYLRARLDPLSSTAPTDDVMMINGGLSNRSARHLSSGLSTDKYHTEHSNGSLHPCRQFWVANWHVWHLKPLKGIHHYN